MRLSIVILAILSFSLSTAYDDYQGPDGEELEMWRAWKNKYSKKYNSEELYSGELQFNSEERERLIIWVENLDRIMHHNMRYDLGLETYSLELNEFSDMTWKEFTSTRCGYRGNIFNPDWRRVDQKPVGDEELPGSIDWRDLGYVTEVKNQGVCGSCWAFSAIGAVEGQYKNLTGTLKEFSEEQLVDCDKTNHGCDGGYYDRAFEFLETHGSISEDSYPYKAGDGDERFCKSFFKKSETVVSGYVILPYGQEDKMKEAVANVGPISVAIFVGPDFYAYKEGVFFQSSTIGQPLNHAVLIVGYGYDESSGLGYWMVKNSWGTEWGDKGYIKIARGFNMCGIASTPMYPLT